MDQAATLTESSAPQTSVSTAAVASPTPSPFLAKYEVSKKLGAGNSGVVYLARDRLTAEHYAVKSITKSKRTSVNQLRLLEKETRLMRALEGEPGVVALHEVFDDPDAMHLVMELCTGGELYYQIIARKNYSEADAATTVRQILRTVATIHSHGILHGDIKPENFLFTDKTYNTLKLIDFGLASEIPPPGHHLKTLSGSLFFMAPELLRLKYNHKVDVWAVGCIAYMLLSGTYPFTGRTEREIFRAIKAGRVSFEAVPWRGVSEAAKNAVRRMLEPDVNRRPEAGEMLWDPWFEEARGEPMEGVEVLRENMRQFREMNRLRQVALLDLARLADDREGAGEAGDIFADLRAQFRLAGTYGEGEVSVEEIRALVEDMGRDISVHSQGQVEVLLRSYDINGTGGISFGEFVAACARRNNLITLEVSHSLNLKLLLTIC